MKFKTLLFLLFLQTHLFAQSQKFTFSRPKMGSPFTILVYAEPKDSVLLRGSVEQVFQRVDALNAIFSDYDSISEISKLSRQYVVNQWFSISKDLTNLVKMSLEAAELSDGAFDITVGKIVKIWRKARRAKQLPADSDLKLALAKTGFYHIQIDEKNQKIRFHTERVELDFGGIVKGFAAQEAIRILSENGFPICLADAGGDLAIGDAPPKSQHTKGWEIGVGLPNSEHQILPKTTFLDNQAIATSGDMYQFLEINGKRYSHIVNPKTGIGLTHQRNVTVIAPDGATADWLATACSVLPIRRAMKLVEKMPNVALLILENRKGKIRRWQTTNFPN